MTIIYMRLAQVAGSGRFMVPVPLLYLHIVPVSSGCVVPATNPDLKVTPTDPDTSRLDLGFDVLIPTLTRFWLKSP